MKNFFTGTLFLIALNSFSQSGINPSITFELLGGKEGIGTVKAEGSPYYNDKFLSAEISGIDALSKSRYNAEADLIEIEYKDEIFALPKEEKYNSIRIANNLYKLYKYTNINGQEVYGYLIELFPNPKDNVSLLKREKIKLQKEKQATNGYSSYTPPKYIKANPEYYLQLKNKEIIAFPKNKKGLIEIFKDKKSEIESFFKANNLSFKDEKDMAKITEFVATL